MRIYYIEMLFVVILLASCVNGTTTVTGHDGRTVVLPKCEPIVKYSGNSLSIKSVDIPVSKVPLKIGEVDWDTKVLTQASEISQILDNHRIRTCQQLPALASGASQALFETSLAEMQDDEYRITTLAILVSANNPKAVENWINAYQPRRVALTAKNQPGKVPEAGGSTDILVSAGQLLKSK